MSDEIDFSGQVAVVTGAGRGIGKAEAVALARRGASLVVNDVAAESADEVVEEIRSRGGTAVASYDSVATPEGGRAIAEIAQKNFSGIHALINNAGNLRSGYFEELTVEDIDSMLDVHLRGAFYVTQPIWSIMKAQRYGRILMTSSSSGFFAHQGLASYAAAKTGLLGLTRALAYEGADFGIGVNAMLPFAASAMPVNSPIPDFTENRRKFVTDDEMKRLSPRRDPSLVAEFAVYLVSTVCEASGQVYSACHGRYARVFAGLGSGWMTSDPDGVVAESFPVHFENINAVDEHSIPRNCYDEFAEVARRLE